ncbi:MAG: hypothetical protein LBR27_05500 [Bifidobacteriaceae bacterium]|nr:hypothetical protein [Bifidobacteriaceae bacterium]
MRRSWCGWLTGCGPPSRTPARRRSIIYAVSSWGGISAAEVVRRLPAGCPMAPGWVGWLGRRPRQGAGFGYPQRAYRFAGPRRCVPGGVA